MWGEEIRALTHRDLENGVHEQIASKIAQLEARNKDIEGKNEWLLIYCHSLEEYIDSDTMAEERERAGIAYAEFLNRVKQLEAENKQLRTQVEEKDDFMLFLISDLMRLEDDVREACGGER